MSADLEKASPEILFVDDEPLYAVRYMQHLREHFTVHYVNDADTALSFLERNSEVRALVLDIMMPPPKGVAPEDVSDGLDTGIWLLRQLQEKTIKVWPLPVMILTNRDPDRVKSGLIEHKISEKCWEVRRKLETPAFLLPDALKALMEYVARRNN